MPENEFDKQVKKLMDDLKLRPSEAVWPGVEKRIRDKKRRRRVFIFLPLLAGLMLLGYSGIQYFLSKSGNKRSGVIFTNEKNKKTDNKVSSPLKSGSAAKKIQAGIKEGSNPQESTVIKKDISLQDKLRKISAFEKNPDSKPFIALSRKNQENLPTSVLENEKNSQVLSNHEDKNIDDKTEKPQDLTSDISNQKNENKIAADVDSNNIKLKNDSIQLKEVTVIKPANDSTVSKTQQLGKKLTWGFHLSTGISGTRSKFFQLNKNKSLDYGSNPNSSTGSPNTAPEPNSTRPGIALQAGMLVEKRFSKRNSLDLGIQYSFYSEHIKVGSRTDSLIRIQASYSADLLVSGFYPNTSTNNYINHYHFIELPLNYHFQLINGKQNSLSWDLGISIGQLLSTNTLVFDTANRGVYYTDKKIFRKIHANLSTGFSIFFNNHKSTHWVIGPKLQLGLSNLYKSYTDKKAFPFFAGIDLRLMLPKK